MLYFLLSAVLFLAIIVLLLIKQKLKRESDLLYFLGSLQNGDFTSKFPQNKAAGLKQLYGEFNRIITEFKAKDYQNEQNYQFLKFVVNHLDIMLIVYDSSQKVHLSNSYTLKLLGVNELYELSQLSVFSEKLYLVLFSGEDQSTVEIAQENESYYFVVKQSVIILDGKPLKLALIQNINTELESREFDAQNSLMRILTHEIMNSIAPITSLASTTRKLAQQLMPVAESDDKDDILAALNAIEKRGSGLFEFVQSYRSLNSLPSPNFKMLDLSDLILDVLGLLKTDLYGVVVFQNFEERISPVLGDRKLLEQLMINLLKNSLEALNGLQKREISISLVTGGNLRPQLIINDNGRGISAEVLPKIFMPFFSTKSGGSGIGLTLCRQIIKQHKGSISAYSDGVNGAKFVLKF